MVRAGATFGGVLILGMLAGSLTEATLAFGAHSSLTNDALVRPAAPRPTTTATPSPIVTPTLAPTPPPTPAPAAAVLTATTNSFVHLRASNSTASAILGDLDGGTVVQILPISDGQWQQVRYNGLVGYLFKAYLTY